MIDVETLKNLRELGGEDDPEFIRSFYSSFLEPIPKHLENIRKAIQTKDAGLLEQAAHAIKSSCGNAGVFEIQKICARLEEMGSENQFEGAEALATEASTLFPRLEKAIYSLPEFVKPVPGNH